MVFYFNRENGRRVSKSTWTRSHAQGGTKYVRRSVKGREQGPQQKPPSGGAPLVPLPETLQTWEQYKRYMEELSKRRKKKIEEEEGYEGAEYETGVDY